MLIGRKTERNAIRAAFAADRARLCGGQHRYPRPLWMLVSVHLSSTPSILSFQGLEKSATGDWRGG
jgi:hypothetical protein